MRKLLTSLSVGLVVGLLIGWSYKDFSKKSLEKEAYAVLGGLFQAAEATRAENEKYPKNLREAGFEISNSLDVEVFYYSKDDHSFRACAFQKSTGLLLVMNEDKKVIKGKIADCLDVFQLRQL